MTSAEWTPWAIASVQAASTAGSPSVSTAVEDIDHLPIAVIDAGELAPHTLHGGRQHPVLEGGAVAQGAGLAGQHRHVMPGIVDRLAAAERARMLGDDPPVLADHDAVRIGMDLDRTPDGAGGHRVLVVVEAHQAGLRDRRRHRVESVEPAGIGDELRPFRLEHLPDRLLGQLRMAVRLGVGDALIEQPGVQLVVGLEPQPRREEALADQPDLVLDLSLLPARGRRAGHRIDEIVAAHLQEAAIVEAVLADEDRLHRRLHVVVDAAAAGALEQSERPVVGVEHHLLRLARIGPHEQHPAVTEPDMGDLHGHRHAAQQDDLVAPVELVGFTRREAQRNVGRGRRGAVLLGPSPGVATNGIVAAVIATPAQFLEQPDQGQTFTRCLRFVRQQQLIERVSPATNLRQRLLFSLVAKLGRSRADHLPYDLPRYTQLPADRLDRLALSKKRATDLPNRLHDQHPNLGFQESWKPMWTLCPGVPIGCRSPRKGGPFCMPIHTPERRRRRTFTTNHSQQDQGSKSLCGKNKVVSTLILADVS